MKVFAILAALAAVHAPAFADSARPGLAYTKTFGGSGSDAGVATATDTAGNVYVVGTTTSTDFPVKNGFQQHLGGAPLRFSPDGGKTWTAAPSLTSAVTAVAGAPGQLYAASNSTIYKSVDSGKTWTALNVMATGVVAILLDPVSPATVYVAAQEGVLRSSDAGLTWAQVEPGPIESLAMSPARPAELFVLSSYGVYLSTDRGTTWVEMETPPPSVTTLAADPSNPDVWYATSQGLIYTEAASGLYKSTDNGNTWTEIVTVPLNQTTPLAVSSNAIYLATNNGVIRSRDGGATWTASLAAAPTVLAADPSQPQTVYAAAGSVYASTDGGTTWTTLLPMRQNVRTVAVVPGAIPGTPSAIFTGASSAQNIFVTKWSGDGQQMLYSTYLGGSYQDQPTGIAVDGLGNAYVTGYTYSNDFPVSPSALQAKSSASYSAFAAKISPDGGTLVYSTYLSGSWQDAASAIAVDAGGDAYVTGFAGSPDFPTTPGAYRSPAGAVCRPPLGDFGDAGYSPGYAFAAKLSADGGTLLYSALAGGSCGEQGQGIAVDASGDAYVAGFSLSTDFPVTPGALQSTTGAGVSTGFLMKLSPQGGLLFATLIGGPFGSTADAVALDGNGNPYLTGCTAGFDSDTFGNPDYGNQFGVGVANSSEVLGIILSAQPPGILPSCGGAAYALKLNAGASSRTYLKYIGSSGDGYAIAVDSAGRAWISGQEYQSSETSAPPFPLVHPFEAWTSSGFVSELSADGSTLLFSSNAEVNGSIALDESGNAFLTGPAYYTLYNPFTGAPISSSSGLFVMRINGAVSGAVTVEAPQVVTVAESPGIATAVAPGEIVVLTGSGLGPAQAAGPQVTAGKVSTTLAGTTVTFDGVPAPLLSVQAAQIECVVPFVVGSASYFTTLQVSSGGTLSNSIRMPAVSANFEILSVVNQDGTLNSTNHPAAAGSIITIYAAGFGQTAPPSVDGQVNGSGMLAPLAGPIDVSFSGYDTNVLYIGPAPGQVAGIFQINLQIPQVDPDQYEVTVDGSGFSSGTTTGTTYSSSNDVSVIVVVGK